MNSLSAYASEDTLPGSESSRIGMLLGLKSARDLDDVALADQIAGGLSAIAAEALGQVIGRGTVIGNIIPEATWRRAHKNKQPLSREMSERLYEISRVIDSVSRAYHGDQEAISHFLRRPHALLAGRTPLQMAQSSSAGADAVLNLLKRAEHGFAV